MGCLALILMLITFLVLGPARRKAKTEPEDSVEEEVGEWTEKITSWLWLVDENHVLPVSFVPEGLKDLEGTGIRLNQDAAEAFLNMSKAVPVPLYAANGYISATAQQNLYDNKWQQYIDEGYSEERAALAIKEAYAPGGQDEHQLGLTVDVSAESNRSLSYDFRSTDQGRWLSEHAWEYGFIYRDETKPWQLRYVGEVHAQIMHEQGLNLEDYLKYLQEKGTFYVTAGAANRNLVIYFTDTLERIPFTIKEVSGDNDGHYIIVCFR